MDDAAYRRYAQLAAYDSFHDEVDLGRASHQVEGSAARKRNKAPDWSEFYRNGIPSEIIVIEDTPEPPAYAPFVPSATSYLANSSYLSGSAASSASFATTVATNTLQSQNQSQNQKQKQGPALKDPPRIATQPCLNQNQNQRTALGDPQPQIATQPCPGLSKGIPIEKRKQEDDSQTLEPDPPSPKRRRTRLQIETESTLEHRLAAANVAYRGLSGPIKRPGDVYIRTLHPSNAVEKRNHDDKDGHYITVPDSMLAGQYQIKKVLGQGTFGKVVSALDRSTGHVVAIKIIRSVQKYRDAAQIELRVLRTLWENDRENRYRTITFRDCFEYQGHTCIVMELLDGSLFDYLKANAFAPFPNSHIQSLARQILTSVAFIHDLGLTHTDLKPENILLRDASYRAFTYHRTIPSTREGAPRQAAERRVLLSPDIQVIDFGSATFESEYHSSVVSTRHYRAPEVMLGLGWSFPCDIWSVGCILVEFFTGEALFQTHDNLEHLAMMEAVFDARIDIDMVRRVNKTRSRRGSAAQYFKRLKLKFPEPDTTRASRRFVKNMKRLEDIIPQTNAFQRQFLDLLRKMFVYNPDERITAKEALLHPWFQEHVRDEGTETAKMALAARDPMPR